AADRDPRRVPAPAGGGEPRFRAARESREWLRHGLAPWGLRQPPQGGSVKLEGHETHGARGPKGLDEDRAGCRSLRSAARRARARGVAVGRVAGAAPSDVSNTAARASAAARATAAGSTSALVTARARADAKRPADRASDPARRRRGAL